MPSLIVPFASPAGEAGRAALRSLALPNLRRALAATREAARDAGDETSLTPPHERAIARALGLAGADGMLPWAARRARADGLDTGDLAWGLVTPAHWHLGTEQVTMIDPTALMLDEASSRALFDAVRELFTSEGFLMLWGAPLRWYLAHESLAELPTASLDRVIGRNVDRWLPDGAAARLLRRLQNEVQMLLHTHPVNDERARRGLLPVNSFWLSGCGLAQPETGPEPRIDDRLRMPALGEDWAAWVKAWETLDAGPLGDWLQGAAADPASRLVLCGERVALTLVPESGWWRRLGARWRGADAVAWLEAL